ncbi:MAG: hypothetical protein IPK81_20375 [Rhodospirillales bacterium]|nr:MAG: hypothetical protein IPK81_20375 [Rhodospirillales bacterium]
MGEMTRRGISKGTFAAALVLSICVYSHGSLAEGPKPAAILKIGDTAVAMDKIKLYPAPPSGLVLGPSGPSPKVLEKGAKVKVVDRKEVSAFFTFYEWVEIEVTAANGASEKWWASNGEKRGWRLPERQERFFEVE